MKGNTIKRDLKDVAGAAENATNSRIFVTTARTGFAVSGALHVLIGLIAIQLAFGQTAQADQSGAMAQLAQGTAGAFLLWLGFTACAALALWQLSEAVFGYRERQPRSRLWKKLAAAGQAVVFLAMALAFSSFALGGGKNSGRSTSDATTELMKLPLGALLLICIGVGLTVTGVVFAIRGMGTTFKKTLSLPSSAAVRAIITGLGLLGYIAKGIALFLVGLLFIIATLQAQPQESTGLDGALKAVREQPYGVYLLTLIGAGLMCYGLYQIAKARFVKM